jgi:hypothetical protein
MRVVDNLIALRIIYLLVTPFQETDAYKLGLIDDKGRNLKKAASSEEKNATSMLHRLVWNLKRIINLAPGGSTKIGSLAAAYLLVKEAVDNNWSEKRLVEEAVEKMNLYSQITFIEEEILVEKCLRSIDNMKEDAPANATGPAVSTDVPTKSPKKLKSLLAGRKMISIS